MRHLGSEVLSMRVRRRAPFRTKRQTVGLAEPDSPATKVRLKKCQMQVIRRGTATRAARSEGWFANANKRWDCWASGGFVAGDLGIYGLRPQKTHCLEVS